MQACSAWLRWCCCGCCGASGDGARADAKGLLPQAASHDDLPLKETTYYTYDVRRISSYPKWMRSRTPEKHPNLRKEWTAARLKQLHLGDKWYTVSTKEAQRGNPPRQSRNHSYQMLQMENSDPRFGRGESKEKENWSDAETVNYEVLGDDRGRSVTPLPWGDITTTSSPVVAPSLAAATPVFAKVLHAPTKSSASIDGLSPPMVRAASAVFPRPQPPQIKVEPSEWRAADENHGDALKGGGGGGKSGGGNDGGGDVEESQRRAPWHTALRRFKMSPARSRSKSPRPGSASSTGDGSGGKGGGGVGGGGGHLHQLARLAPSLAISTPDLAKSSKVALFGPRSVQTLGVPSRVRGASSSCLPRELAVEASTTNFDQRRNVLRSEASADYPQGQWSHKRSMESEDYETEPSTPVADDVFQDGESMNLAHTFGLDKNLYTLQQGESYSAVKQPTSWSSSICSTPSIPIENFVGGISPIKVEDSHSFSSFGFLPNQENYVDQPCGTIVFSASYYQKNKKLCVELDHLENLPPKGKNNVYGVIVRLSILPSDKQVKSTQVLKGSLSPLIKEDFNFSIKDPAGKIMRFTVFNSMFQGKHDAIGYSCFNVEDVICEKPRKFSMKLTRQSLPGPSCGSLQVYLQLSQEQRLIVDVIQARNLCSPSLPKGSRSAVLFSTYVKTTFYCAGQKVKSKKSSVVTCDRNPQYEFSSDFKIDPEQLNDSYIVFSIVLKVSLRKDITLGRYILGPFFFSATQEITPWGRAILNREQICHWFNLYL